MMTSVHVCMHAYTPMMQHYLSLFLSVLSLSLSLFYVFATTVSLSLSFSQTYTLAGLPPTRYRPAFPVPGFRSVMKRDPTSSVDTAAPPAPPNVGPADPDTDSFPRGGNRKGGEGEDKNTIVGILSGCVGDARIQNVHVRRWCCSSSFQW